jgi:hypothetical protein
MAAGKHVISEKPLAMTTKESKELVKLAAKAGVVNAIDFNYRYYPLVQEAKDMVASGKLRHRVPRQRFLHAGLALLGYRLELAACATVQW